MPALTGGQGHQSPVTYFTVRHGGWATERREPLPFAGPCHSLMSEIVEVVRGPASRRAVPCSPKGKALAEDSLQAGDPIVPHDAVPATVVSVDSGESGRRAAFFWGLVLPILLFLAQAICLWGFTIDDVAISYRYALHLASGDGLGWNPGASPVEGCSNFLWVLILAAVKWTGLDTE